MIKQYLFALILFILMINSIAVVVAEAFDLSGPILSERNPNGTIDYWYIGSGAEE